MTKVVILILGKLVLVAVILILWYRNKKLKNEIEEWKQWSADHYYD